MLMVCVRACWTRCVKLCEYRNILPRGVKLSAEVSGSLRLCSVGENARIRGLPGKPKSVSLSRQCAAFVSGVVKDAFILWLNQNVQAADCWRRWRFPAPRRMRAAEKSGAQKLTSGPALPGKLADCTAQDL